MGSLTLGHVSLSILASPANSHSTNCSIFMNYLPLALYSLSANSIVKEQKEIHFFCLLGLICQIFSSKPAFGKKKC
jgi:hypothetical protein